MNYTEQEQQSVSNQVDMITDHAHNRFKDLLQEGRREDAIAIGDEYFEWLADIDEETLLFFNENELFQ